MNRSSCEFYSEIEEQVAYWHQHTLIYSEEKMYWVPIICQTLSSGLGIQRLIPLNSTKQRKWIKSNHQKQKCDIIQLWKKKRNHSWVNKQLQKLFCSFVWRINLPRHIFDKISSNICFFFFSETPIGRIIEIKLINAMHLKIELKKIRERGRKNLLHLSTSTLFFQSSLW